MIVVPTVGEALADFREANGLCQDEHLARWWIVRAGSFALPLPNFAWRRRAIAAHDVHHMLTGYPCTVMGELQLASWEFGAGRYPHWGATLFCAPLVLIGLVWAPQDVVTAWRRGRRQRSLYGDEVIEQLLNLSLWRARALLNRSGFSDDDAAASG